MTIQIAPEPPKPKTALPHFEPLARLRSLDLMGWATLPAGRRQLGRLTWDRRIRTDARGQARDITLAG